MRFFERDLRIKVTVLVLSLLIVALVASGIVSYSISRGITTSYVDDHMLDAVRLTRNLVEVALERRYSRMELLASLPTLRDPSAPPPSKAEGLKIFIDTWPIGSSAVLLDTGGNAVAATSNLPPLADADGTSWFKHAQAGRITFTYVSDKKELAAISAGSPVLAVSGPIRDRRDQIFNYVVAFTDMADIRKAVGGVKIADSGHAALIDSGGSVIAGSLTRERKAPAADKSSELLEEMTGGRTGRFTYSSGVGRYLIAYTPVEPAGLKPTGTRWFVGVIVPYGEAYAPVSRIAWSLLALTVLFVLLSAVAAVLSGRSITRPVKELAESAERIGSGDLTGAVTIRTRDQIGTLAASFIRMRDQLRGAVSEVRHCAESMTSLAEEQSAATEDVFSETEEIVESAAVLAKNMEAQTEKIRRVSEYVSMMAEEIQSRPAILEVQRLLEDAVILAEVGSGKAVEIASSTQSQRAAARDVASAARQLSGLARELQKVVKRFKT